MVCAPGLAVAATSYTWKGSSTGFWHVNTNWSPVGVPTNGDTAFITAAGAIVNLDGFYANMVGNLTIDSDHEVRTTITSLTNYDSYFTFSVLSGSATLANDGIFRLADTGMNSWIYPNSSRAYPARGG